MQLQPGGRALAITYQGKTRMMQEGLLAEATAFRDANIVDVTSYEELKQAIEEGKWARGAWAGDSSQLHCLA